MNRLPLFFFSFFSSFSFLSLSFSFSLHNRDDTNTRAPRDTDNCFFDESKLETRNMLIQALVFFSFLRGLCPPRTFSRYIYIIYRFSSREDFRFSESRSVSILFSSSIERTPFRVYIVRMRSWRMRAGDRAGLLRES